MISEVEYQSQLTDMLRDIVGATRAFYTYLEVRKFYEHLQGETKAIDAEFWEFMIFNLLTTFLLSYDEFLIDQQAHTHCRSSWKLPSDIAASFRNKP